MNFTRKIFADQTHFRIFNMCPAILLKDSADAIKEKEYTPRMKNKKNFAQGCQIFLGIFFEEFVVEI